MKTDRQLLERACFDLVRSIRWKDGPIEKVVAQAMVPGYVEIALHHEDFLVGQGRDPNIIVRAVRYLAHVHAIPPHEGNMEWFKSAMDILIELACPNTGVESDQEPFFQDLLQGINEARSDY